VDEYVFSSLQASGDKLSLPGGFTAEGIRRGISSPYITRYFFHKYFNFLS
jgi:hypothetical protein